MEDYEEIYDFLSYGTYPTDFSKNQKRALRRKCNDYPSPRHYPLANSVWAHIIIVLRRLGRVRMRSPEQTVHYIIENCPLYRPNGEQVLLTLDYDTRSWLESAELEI